MMTRERQAMTERNKEPGYCVTGLGPIPGDGGAE